MLWGAGFWGAPGDPFPDCGVWGGIVGSPRGALRPWWDMGQVFCGPTESSGLWVPAKHHPVTWVQAMLC